MNTFTELSEIAQLFFRLGCTAFGGPAAHIAMMEEEVVRKRKWIDHQHFLDLIGTTNLIPGPNSTEMAMHCGMERAGFKGLIVAGVCFITPAVVLTSLLAWLYQQYGQLPAVQPFIYGISAAVVALILSALVPLGKKAIKNTESIVLGVLVLFACLMGTSEIVALFGCGLTGVLLYLYKKNFGKGLHLLSPLLLQVTLPENRLDNLQIFQIFFKIGALLYGSGYVLFAFLDAEMVQTHLLTSKVLADALAAGQLTPGPVLATATFIGWQKNGLSGAAAATTGVFLPSFLFVAMLNPILPKLRKSKMMSAFLDAVNVASVAIILVVCLKMAKAAIVDWRTAMILAISLIVVFLFKKVSGVWIVAASAAMGYFLTLINL